jgi:peptidyl-tRNA hydrolase, PTH1 family
MKEKLLIVGLGNPGDKYKHTRHNIGFQILDSFVDKLNLNFKQDKKAPYTEYIVDGQIIYFIKPFEFMNLSGNAVLDYKRKKGIHESKILIIHDEIDFVFGKCKMKIGGGHAGHNGLRDIIEKIGTNDFHRLRVGVGKSSNIEVSDYVLSKFTAEEIKPLDEIIKLCIAKIEDWIRLS